MVNQIIDNVLIIKPDGKIDTNNADQFGNEVSSFCQDNPNCELVFDFENVNYISSAGLRQILRFKKLYKNLKIINVSSEVYEIFDMTGFSEMLSIEKAYRKISVEGCEVIGEGSNGIVYRLNPDTIVKVYKNNDAIEDIKRERELAKKALVMGINTAISYDIVKVDDKFGSVFELLSSKSITKWINSDPENIDKYITIYTNFLKEIHSIVVKDDSLPNEKEIQIKRILYLKDYLDAKHYEKLYDFINSIPEDDHMLHGDFHPGNIHYDGNEAILIDMDTISRGNNIFEISAIYSALQGFSLVNKNIVEKFLNIKHETATYIFNKFLDLYYGKEDHEDIINKIKVLSYSRILRRTLKRDKDNIELINASFKELIDSLDKI